MADLSLGVEVTGVDDAVAGLGRVEQAAAGAAANATQRFSQSVQQIREEAEWNEEITRARERAARETDRAARATAAATTVQRQAVTATRQTATATRDAGSATQQYATQAIQFTQRLQGVLSAVTSLSGALGNRGGATGLAASLAATTAQAAAMGNAFGPGGALVAGVLGLSYGIAQIAEASDSAAGAQSRLREQFSLSIDRIDQYIARAREAATQTRRMAMIEQGLGSVDEQFAAADLAGREVGRVGAERARVRHRLQDLQERNRYQDLDEVRRLRAREAQLSQEYEAAHAESLRLGQLALQAQEDERQISEDAASLAMDADIAQGGGGTGEHGRARRLRRELGIGGGGSTHQKTEAEIRAGTTAHLAEAATEGRVMSATTLGTVDLNQTFSDQREAMVAAREETKRLQEAQYELANASQDAVRAFAEGWTNSLDDVVQAWREANNALKAQGQQALSMGRLLERGLVATGNNIADTIGGTMKGAFEDALGAWLDGSKDFVKAAEDMAKGVIKALVIESIVQGVTELARGIADLAGYHYDSAALHFAAAGAWAAVGVAAGAIGAGIGAFGGAGKGEDEKGGGARDIAAKSVREEAATQPIVVQVFPAWLTQREVQEWTIQNVNGAARDGAQLDPRLMRSRGR